MRIQQFLAIFFSPQLQFTDRGRSMVLFQRPRIQRGSNIFQGVGGGGGGSKVQMLISI